MPVTVFVLVKLEPGKESQASSKIKALAPVKEMYIVSGEYDLLLKLEAADMDAAMDIVINQIRATPGVIETRTSIARKLK